MHRVCRHSCKYAGSRRSIASLTSGHIKINDCIVVCNQLTVYVYIVFNLVQGVLYVEYVYIACGHCYIMYDDMIFNVSVRASITDL